jgi:hypothetical protein
VVAAAATFAATTTLLLLVSSSLHVISLSHSTYDKDQKRTRLFFVLMLQHQWASQEGVFQLLPEVSQGLEAWFKP